MIPQHATLEISRSRLQHNLNLLRSQLPPQTKICATLKANAYGHGTALIAQLLQEAHIEWLAVYSLEEALQLPTPPSPGIAIPGPTSTPTNIPNILTLAPFVLLHPPSPETLQQLRPQIRLNIIDAQTARHLSAALPAVNLTTPLNIHLQIDTGLTRSGAPPELLPQLADTIANLPNLHLEGLFAHFSHADVPNHPATQEQSTLFHQLAAPLKKKYPHLLLHTQNSGAALHSGVPCPARQGPPLGMPNVQSHSDCTPSQPNPNPANPSAHTLDLARIGIALYGLQPNTAHPIQNLQPIARLTAPILAIHQVPKNTGVGYSHTFTTSRPSRLAILPAGYAEGYPRSLSNHALAQHHSTNLPLVARISMDQIIADITGVPQAQLGDPITLISWNPADPNSLDRMADATGTIPYELATHLGPRLHRIIVD